MGVDKMNGHIQTLFLISNSFNGFVFGVFLFAFGVGRGVLLGMTSGYAWCIAVGLAVVGLALLGYSGAVNLNRKALHTYASLTIGGAALETAHLVVLSLDVPPGVVMAMNLELQAFFITMICIIVIATVSALLACTLSLQIRRHGGATAGCRQ